MTTMVVTCAAVTVTLALPAQVAAAPSPTRLAERLVDKVSAQGANRHLIAFQRIADRNDGNRAAGTPGYDASVDYVVGRLQAAGYDVSTPEFSFDQLVAGDLTVGDTNIAAQKILLSANTPEGGVTAPLAVVPEDADTGCQAEDYAGLDVTGDIAVIRRGGCTFEIKAATAATAGAVVAVISDNVPPAPFRPVIENAATVPAGFVSQEDGDILAGLDGQSATVDLRSEMTVSRNVIAQTRSGRPDNVVMLGAHLDSVPEGPGINDNGSGSAALLEIALKLGPDRKGVNNAVRFAWWGAEELGLLGSEAYVASLDFEQQLDIAMYLNFDMIGSPNAGYFVYDGDDSAGTGAGPGPFGSAQIEETFNSYLRDQAGVEPLPTDFDGRSDYGPFIAAGIPAGGLFTGAEDIKTPEEAALWGGTAGIAFDPCYHAVCDTLGNLDRTALGRNLDAAAWTTGVYAYSTDTVNGVPPRDVRAQARVNTLLAAAAPAGDAQDAA
ncbi:M28 family metallopeptidase [Nakamurella leprariae]|nr:M28 family metallopeptidase [Nakamurella leprariae]